MQNFTKYLNSGESLTPFLFPFLIIIIGTVLGFIFKRIVHSRLIKIANRSKWEGDDVILNAIDSQIILWFFLGSVSISLRGASIIHPSVLFLSKLLIVILIASITHSLAKLIVGLVDIWSKKQGGGFPSTTMFTNFIWVIVYAIGSLIILDSLNISIAPMLTALGVGGLAVSLALKDTLSDVFSGLHILLSKKVVPGDFVSLDSGEMGYIQNITWRNTKMLERSNNIIQIPNTKLSSAIIKNYDSGDPSFSVKILLGVGYESNLEEVEKIVMDVATELHSTMEEVNKESEPSFKFRAFGESSIDFAVYFRGNKYGDQNPIIHEFIKRLHKEFKDKGIEIPYPMRTIIQRTG